MVTAKISGSSLNHVICCDCGKRIVRCKDELMATLIQDTVGECPICNTKAVYRGELLTDSNYIVDEKFTPINPVTTRKKQSSTGTQITQITRTAKGEPREINSSNYKDVADKHYTREIAIEMGLMNEECRPIGSGNKGPINKAIRLAIRFALYRKETSLLNELLVEYSEEISKGARYFDKLLKEDLKQETGLDLDN